MTRAALALLVLAAMPGGVAAQARTGEPPAAQRPAARQPSPAARPFGPGTGQPRLTPNLTESFDLGTPRQPGRAAPAPVPNRGIEAPRDRYADSLAPTLEPMMLPPDRRQGQTFGREHLRETGPDRPFDLLVPGARLRIPLEPSAPSR